MNAATNQSEQIVLPFAEREYIDARRACRILGVSYRTLMRLAKSEHIEWLDHGKISWKRVRYKSVVDFCDRLREEHKIADRRPQLSAAYLRHRDEDLLPFPLRDTMTAQQALQVLGFAKTDSLVRLIEEGRFEAYQLAQQAPWRVSRASLIAYLDRLRAPAPADDPARYKVCGKSPHF
ncbi:MAG: hypothetical protein WCC87_10405 [Candidatus Korobacteraceae bacterium]